jgi:hypothetical protein
LKLCNYFFQNLNFHSKGNRFSTKSFNQRATESIPLQESKIPSDENSNKKLRNSLIFFGCVSMGLLSYDGWFVLFSLFLSFKKKFLSINDINKRMYFAVGLLIAIESCYSMIQFSISPFGNNLDPMFITLHYKCLKFSHGNFLSLSLSLSLCPSISTFVLSWIERFWILLSL